MIPLKLPRVLAPIFFAAVFLFASCTKSKDGFDSTESGLKYKFVKSAEGKKPSKGDVMIMRINYQTDFDSIIFDSHTKSDSFTVVLVAPTYIGGVEEGFALMSKGDSAIFKVSADSVFLRTFHSDLPDYLKPGSMLTFHVAIDDIIPASVKDSIESARDIESRVKEFERIDRYLQQNNMDVRPTENGAYFVASKQGVGEYPVKGDTVYVTYSGKLLDGTIFDQQLNKERPFKFVLGTNEVIAGWGECIPLMNKGAVAKIVLPSDLGFGAKPYGTLPPYSTLVFDVELLDIRKGTKNK